MMFLVAEDNAQMRDSIKRYLSTRIPDRHTVYEAGDGAEAIELYERFRPDWVLMDIAMEPIDGLTASRRILEMHPDANIIILTNYDDAGYRAAAKKAGTKAFVLKEHLSTIGSILSPHQVGDSA
jgi:two-component system response regulator DegU